MIVIEMVSPYDTCLERHFSHHIRLQDDSPLHSELLCPECWLVHIYSAVSYLHSSIRVMVCALHEHLTIHLVKCCRSSSVFHQQPLVLVIRLKRWECMFRHYPRAIPVLHNPTYWVLQLCPVPKCWFDSVYAVCAE